MQAYVGGRHGLPLDPIADRLSNLVLRDRNDRETPRISALDLAVNGNGSLAARCAPLLPGTASKSVAATGLRSNRVSSANTRGSPEFLNGKESYG